MKRFNKVFPVLGLGLIFSIGVRATILVNPPAPYNQNVMGATGYTIYYGGSTTGTAYIDPSVNPAPAPALAPFFNTQAFRILNTSDAVQMDYKSGCATCGQDNWLWLDVQSNQAFTGSPSLVVTLSTGTSAGTEIPIRGAIPVTSSLDRVTVPIPCNQRGQNCQGLNNNGQYLSANYTSNAVLRLAVSIHDICGTTGTLGTLCNGTPDYRTLAGATVSQAINVTVGVVPNNSVVGPVGTTPIASPSPVVGGTPTPDTSSFTLSVTDIPPTIQCPQGDITQWYFPGDTQIYLKMANFAPGSGTGVSGTGATPYQYLVYGKNGSVPATGLAALTSNANDIAGFVPIGGSGVLTGLKNTDATGSTNQYQMVLAVENQAGVVSAPACTFPNTVQSQTISGVLTESKCFIATAAFQDGRAAPVMLLRRFRDSILSRFDLGRDFIRTYYRYSPALAEWAWDKPIVRSFALRLLAPVELAAWVMLKIAGAEEVKAPDESYSETLKKKILAKDLKDGKVQESGSYSERLKKELEPESAAGESYTEQERKKLEAKENNAGYTEDEKAKLPPEKHPESPIQMVKENRDVIPVPERPPIHHGVGLRVGVAPGINVTNSKGTHTFQQVYGNSWNPEVIIHYERQFFHSENFGSFGLGLDVGMAYGAGYGQLAVGFANTTASQTPFTFYQVPFVINGQYRFNLFRILRPYVSGGAGTMVYVEDRKDNVSGYRGYTFIWQANLGVALLMDFMDRKTSLDAFMSEGIQHVYLVAEYEYLNTFSGPVVFQRNGIYSGFLFEF